ncbi:MAG: NAD(P)/FAD-dependent oxidoreductase [Acidobacteriaceae bacterium]|nr:NAD(P)/FAD-dependent oxidoreductase [Acidobacteriaceae bacterium]
MSFDADAIVLGAGMAGLAAARALAERNLRVLVLEARERVGGRILSQQVEGDVIELGAEFIHGRAPELWALIEEAGVETTERGGVMLRQAEGGSLREEDDHDEEFFAPLAALEEWKGEDVSFAEWVAASNLPEWQKPVLTSYVEGFNAADAEKIGVVSLGIQQKAEEASEGERAWHVRGGYVQLPEYLAKRCAVLGVDVRLTCEALALRWRAGHVEVETNRCGLLTAPRCIVALPLGVLQRVNDVSGMRMAPEPEAIAQARQLCMGSVARVVLSFRSAWWQTSQAASRELLEQLSFLFTDDGPPNVWWTPHPEPQAHPTITGWVGGPRSAALLGHSVEELADEACAQLAEVFAVEASVVRGELISATMHDWTADQYACGAYSYVPAGAIDAPGRMCEPVAETLFFAGEHTDVTGHWGTVHAALRTGLRAAAQMLGEA